MSPAQRTALALALGLSALAPGALAALQIAPPGAPPARQVSREPRTVDPAALVVQITVSPSMDTINAGECRRFTATALDGGGHPVAIPAFRFAVSDPSRFQADELGSVCALPGLPAATTQISVGFANSAIQGTAALTVRETPLTPQGPNRGGPWAVASPRQPTPLPPLPSELATTPVAGFTAAAPRPLTIELSWQPLLGATGYLIWRDGQVITSPQPVRGGTTYTDHDVPPGKRNYAIAATFRLPDGKEGLTQPRFLSLASATARGLPKPAQAWLARPGGTAGDPAEVDKYRRQFQVDNLQDWIARFVPTRASVRAVFFNAGDLAFGRDMRCGAVNADASKWRQEVQHLWLAPAPVLACYVSNHGPKPGQPGFPSSEASIGEAIAGHRPFATVAMELYVDGEVRFRAFGEDGSPVTQVVLDTEGPKPVPDACLSCHGGQYDPQNGVRGASFLPFDVYSFEFSRTNPAFSLASQEQAFRRLNEWVAAARQYFRPVPGAQTPDLISDFVAGLSTAGASYVPVSWNKEPALYRDVVRPYCRTCHLAARPDIIASSDAFLSYKPRLQATLCGLFTMPHAEIPYRKFWASKQPSAPATLASALNISCGG